MNGTPLLLAIIGHLVGDYLLQNDWMALNKKRPGYAGVWPCMLHAAIWTMSVCVFAGWARIGYGAQSPQYLVLFLLHYWQDRTGIVFWWMIRNGQRQFAGPPCGPWSIIVVDNVWHIVSLWAVWRFIP